MEDPMANEPAAKRSTVLMTCRDAGGGGGSTRVGRWMGLLLADSRYLAESLPPLAKDDKRKKDHRR